MAEIASIYRTEEERLLNKPRRQAVPNPALELDMSRYRLKIEKKFAESFVNNSFKMPRLQQPWNIRQSDSVLVDTETAMLLSNRCNSQLYPTDLTVDFGLSGTIMTPSSSSAMDTYGKKPATKLSTSTKNADIF